MNYMIGSVIKFCNNVIESMFDNIDNTFGQDRMKKMLYGSAATVMANALAFATDFK